jgi:hypothetical protein
MHQFSMVHTCRTCTPRMAFQLAFQASRLEEGVVIHARHVAALVDEWGASESATEARTIQEKVWSLWGFLAKALKDEGHRVLVAHVSTEVFGETFAFDPTM